MPRKDKKSGSSSKKSKKAVKGTVAFLYSGALKTGWARLFWTEELDTLEDTVAEHRSNYGSEVSCRYIKCENPEKVYNKVLKKLGDSVDHDSVVQSHATTLVNTLKEVADVKQAHRLAPETKKTSKKSGSKSAKKGGSKSAKKGKGKKVVESDDEGSDDEESDDEGSDNDGSDAEASDAEGSDDEVSEAESSDNESSDDESEDEAPKKSKKGKGKNTKSKSGKKGKKSRR